MSEPEVLTSRLGAGPVCNGRYRRAGELGESLAKGWLARASGVCRSSVGPTVIPVSDDADSTRSSETAANRAASQHGINLLARNGANPVVWLLQLPRRLWGLFSVGVLLKTRAREQRDELHPGIVLGGQRVDALERLAWEMASNGREDAEAVRTLLGEAGRHRGDLRWAAAQVRSQHWITEDATAYRANELLLAAAKNRPVQPVTDDQEAWFQQLDALTDGSDEAAFARLVALQPRMADIDHATAPIFDELRNAELDGRDLSHARHTARRQFEQILDPLVGPNADSTEPLVRSHRAYKLAERRLRHRMYERRPPSSW